MTSQVCTVQGRARPARPLSARQRDDLAGLVLDMKSQRLRASTRAFVVPVDLSRDSCRAIVRLIRDGDKLPRMGRASLHERARIRPLYNRTIRFLLAISIAANGYRNPGSLRWTEKPCCFGKCRFPLQSDLVHADAAAGLRACFWASSPSHSWQFCRSCSGFEWSYGESQG